jgi:hypothetical protein
MQNLSHSYKKLWDMGHQTLLSLETSNGILASGKNEIYGCVFGRDSLISALLFLQVYRKSGIPYFRDTAKKILLGLAELQGKEINVESGEEPGKCIHEFRPDRHEHLTKRAGKTVVCLPGRHDALVRHGRRNAALFNGRAQVLRNNGRYGILRTHGETRRSSARVDLYLRRQQR